MDPQGRSNSRADDTYYYNNDHDNRRPRKEERRRYPPTSEEEDSDIHHYGRSDSRLSDRRISFSRQNSIYMPTTEDEFSDPYDIDSPDKPASPAHFIKAENPYYMEPLSNAGRIYRDKQAYRVTPITQTGLLESAYRNISSLGYNPEDTKQILSTCLLYTSDAADE